MSTAEKCFNILSQSRRQEEAAKSGSYITESQLEAVVADILRSHPGLAFFRQEPEERIFACYIETVVVSLQFAAEAWRQRRIHFHQFSKVGILPSYLVLTFS